MKRVIATTRRPDERGSALVLVLIFITTFAIGMVAVLDYSTASIRAGSSQRQIREDRGAAAGAIDLVIASLRTDGALGVDGGGCPSTKIELDSVAAATCAGLPTSGAVRPGVNAPNHALRTTAADEVGLTVTGSGTLAIDGALFSESHVVADGTTITSGDTSIKARGACKGTVEGASVTCELADAKVPEADDGEMSAPLAKLPERRTVPSCSAKFATYELQPGHYDDADALSALTDGSCPGALVWLTPGDYYFDFDLDPTANAVWTIADDTVDVVGGTPDGWSPKARAELTVPGTCVAPPLATATDGVRLVFGGASRILVKDGDVEMCAGVDDGVPVVATALDDGTAPAAQAVTSRAATAVDGGGTGAFGAPGDARTVDGTSASATLAPPAGGGAPVLDGLSVKPEAAYGLRRLITGYSGPLVRVRRASDGATKDIGFAASGALDTANLLAFTGAGDGFVTMWYDQIGGNNLTQATAAKQPRVVIGGVVQTGLRFTGATDSHLAADKKYTLGGAKTGWHYDTVMVPRAAPATGGPSDGSGWYFFDRTTGTNNLISFKAVSVSGTTRYCLQKRANSGGNLGCATSAAVATVDQWRIVGLQRVPDVDYAVWVDGTKSGSIATGPSDPLNAPQLKLNAHATSGVSGNAEYAEVIVWGSELSTADRQLLEGDQAWTFGIASSLPAGHPYRSTKPSSLAGISGAGSSTRTAELSLSSFGSVTPAPGSVALGATLRVTHGESVPAGAGITPDASGGVIVADPAASLVSGSISGRIDLTVTVVPGDGSAACKATVPATARPGGASLTTTTIDVTSCLDTDAKRTGATVRYDTSTDAGVTVTHLLDGIEVDYVWQPPGLRAQSGCVIATGGCAWFELGAEGRLALRGTVDAPNATLALDLGGVAATVVERGAIVRSVTVVDPGDGTVPVFGLGAVRMVEISAEVESGPFGAALVRIVDSPTVGAAVVVRRYDVGPPD